jgi:hypothetical protein
LEIQAIRLIGNRKSAIGNHKSPIANPQPLLHNPRSNQLIQLRKLSIEVCAPAFEDLSLFSAAHPSASILAIPGVQLIHDIHPFDNATYRRKTIGVQSRVLTNIDVQLGSSSVRSCHRVGYRPAIVALSYRVIGKCLFSPHGGDLRIARDSELSNKARAHSKKARVIEEPCPHQIVETIDAARRPIPMKLDNEEAFGCFKSDFENIRRTFTPNIMLWIEQYLFILDCLAETSLSENQRKQYMRNYKAA